MSYSEKKIISRNRQIHDKIANKYDFNHIEIFNKVEQARLRKALEKCLNMVSSSPNKIHALDFGAGTGNLTRHLVELGALVTAVDISSKSLELLEANFDVNTAVINGEDLSDFADESFDFIATYSVLHHIPDYLKAVEELARVCKKGGIVFIDHEPSESYWQDQEKFQNFKKMVEKVNFKKFIYPQNYLNKIISFFYPKRTNEGDIHVWPDDHIQWSKVQDVLEKRGLQTEYRETYLLFKGNYKVEVYNDYKNSIGDTQVMAFKKV